MSSLIKTQFANLRKGDVFRIDSQFKKFNSTLFIKIEDREPNKIACNCGNRGQALNINVNGGHVVHFCDDSNVKITNKAASYNIAKHLA